MHCCSVIVVVIVVVLCLSSGVSIWQVRQGQRASVVNALSQRKKEKTAGSRLDGSEEQEVERGVGCPRYS